MQMLKVYVLARVTPSVLRQLLAMVGIPAGGPAAAAAAAKGQASSGAAPVAAAKQHKAGGAAAANSDATADGTTPTAAALGSVPSDDELASSNVLSAAEACLLAWLQVHAVKAFPKLVSK
jgi:hypothetical protein